MKTAIKVLTAIAAISTPLFALEPTLETQKHDSSLMMDGMKSLNSKVEATWVSKEQTESVAKESASILKDAKTEIAPAVAREKAALAVSNAKVASNVPNLPASQDKKESKSSGVLSTVLKVGAGVVLGVGLVVAAAIHFMITHPMIL